ncbi:hypothetical protein [Marinitenerispora sediminis]|uniref:hypothetical protein n=1 Tax=Marinitenerispora sediminis TaxID=1931232 RepID=UPI001314ABF8|nr:hypothetical protein [Marinitenerispora sediminis]
MGGLIETLGALMSILGSEGARLWLGLGMAAGVNYVVHRFKTRINAAKAGAAESLAGVAGGTPSRLLVDLERARAVNDVRVAETRSRVATRAARADRAEALAGGAINARMAMAELATGAEGVVEALERARTRHVVLPRDPGFFRGSPPRAGSAATATGQAPPRSARGPRGGA